MALEEPVQLAVEDPEGTVPDRRRAPAFGLVRGGLGRFPEGVALGAEEVQEPPPAAAPSMLRQGVVLMYDEPGARDFAVKLRGLVSIVLVLMIL
jgi:hypothetical protein